MNNSQIINSESALKWKTLIVDQDKGTHKKIREFTRGLKFENKEIVFKSAYAISEAISILKKENDMALVFIDINIGEKNRGLKLTKYIHQVLNMTDTRIIFLSSGKEFHLREDILLTYDINGYSNKSIFFYKKIKSVIISCLRGYRDIKNIRENRDTMKNVVDSITDLHKLRDLQSFLEKSICYLSKIINKCDLKQDAKCKVSSFVAIKKSHTERFIISSGTGKYKNSKDNSIRDSVSIEDHARLDKLYLNGEHKLFKDIYIAKYTSSTGKQAIILVENLNNNTYVDSELLNLFYKSISANFDNLCLNLEIDETQREIIYTLGEVTEARSQETGFHIKRVSRYSRILAREYGLSKDQVELIAKASPIHDIGKVSIPDEILNKKGKLTAEEFNRMKTHTTTGYNLLKNSEGEVLKAAAIIAHQHHERYDGGGYPRGLAGEKIHIYGRITAIADVFDALGSDRVYKKAWVMGDILNLFRQERGRQFDPELVDILFENLDEFLEVKRKYEDGLGVAQNCEL